MSDNHGLPRTPQEAANLMNNLTFDAPPAPERETELLTDLPPQGSEIMVVRSYACRWNSTNP